MTQQELSNQSMVSVSTIKKIEDGQINSFDSLLRLMRILGKLDLLQELTKEEKLSPNEYYAMVNSVKKHQRKRARSSKKKCGGSGMVDVGKSCSVRTIAQALASLFSARRLSAFLRR